MYNNVLGYDPDIVRPVVDPDTGGINVCGPDGLPLGAKPRQTILAKCPTGFLQSSAGYGGYTSHIQTVLEGRCKRIRIHLPNISPTVESGVKVSVGTSDTLGASASNGSKGAGVVLTPFTFGGAATVDKPARRSATRPSWVTSDWLNFTTVARADGGTLPCLHLRVVGTAGETATWFGGFGVWSDETATLGRVWRGYRSNAAGDYIDNSGFESASTNYAVAGHHALVIEYELANGDGRVLHISGDSIYMGAGAGVSLLGFTWAAHAQCILSYSKGVPVELCNLACSGQTAQQYSERYLDLINILSPGAITIYEAGSPNNLSAPTTKGNIDSCRTALLAVRSAVVARGNNLVCPDMLPANALAVDGGSGLASAKSFGSGDYLRSLYNAEIRVLCPYVIPFSEIASGNAVASGTAAGQVEYRAGDTGDGLHPADVLNARLAVAVVGKCAPLI